MAKKLYEEANISAIASAIRSMNGLSSVYTVSEMAPAILSIPVGSSAVLEELSVSANGSYSPSAGVDGFSNVVVSVPTGGDNAGLISDILGESYELNLSESGNLRSYAFAHSPVQKIHCPNISALETFCFGSCVNLTEVVFENLISISHRAFQWCSNLVSANFPKVTNIGHVGGTDDLVFGSCSKLSDINIPECTVIGISAFGYCIGLTSISLPKVEEIYDSAFANCTHLKEINLPACRVIHKRAFTSCGQLSVVYLSVCSNIISQAFNPCTNLVSLYLYSTAVVEITGYDPFAGTKLSGNGSGMIYVPASLVNDYKEADRWSIYASKIVSIPE